MHTVHARHVKAVLRRQGQGGAGPASAAAHAAHSRPALLHAAAPAARRHAAAQPAAHALPGVHDAAPAHYGTSGGSPGAALRYAPGAASLWLLSTLCGGMMGLRALLGHTLSCTQAAPALPPSGFVLPAPALTRLAPGDTCATALRRKAAHDAKPLALTGSVQAESDHHVKDTYNYVTVQTDTLMPTRAIQQVQPGHPDGPGRKVHAVDSSQQHHMGCLCFRAGAHEAQACSLPPPPCDARWAERLPRPVSSPGWRRCRTGSASSAGRRPLGTLWPACTPRARTPACWTWEQAQARLPLAGLACRMQPCVRTSRGPLQAACRHTPGRLWAALLDSSAGALPGPSWTAAHGRPARPGGAQGGRRARHSRRALAVPEPGCQPGAHGVVHAAVCCSQELQAHAQSSTGHASSTLHAAQVGTLRRL